MKHIIYSLCVLAYALSTSAALAQVNTWIGPANGDWDNAANWSLGVVPNAPTSLPLTEADPVRIDANSGQDSTVNIDNDSTFRVGELTLDSGDTIAIGANSNLIAAPILNAGKILVNGAENSNTGLRLQGTLFNDPGGRIELHQAALTRSGTAETLLWNQGVVEGSGAVQVGTLWNEQLIDANDSGQILEISFGMFPSNPSGLNTLINTGDLRASAGGTLQLIQGSDDLLLNEDSGFAGTIEAQGDSTVQIDGANIVGGRILGTTTGGVEAGRVRFGGALSLTGVELDAEAEFNQVRLSDSVFSNLQTIDVSSTQLRLLGNATVSGGGRFELSGNSEVVGENSTNDDVLPKFTNLDNTISVTSDPQANSLGKFGEYMLVENHGIFEASGPQTQLVLNLTGPQELPFGEAAWENRGTIRAINGGQVVMNSFDGRPLDNVGGTIEIDGNSNIDFNNEVRIVGGTIRGPSVASDTAPSFFSTPIFEGVRLEGALTWSQSLGIAGTVENTGSLASDEVLTARSNQVELTGGGEVFASQIRSETSSGLAATLINVDNTFRINNQLLLSGVQLINRGNIDAEGLNGSDLRLFLISDFPLTNSGVIRVTGGARLEIDADPPSIINYEIDDLGNVIPGKIQAGVDSQLQLQSVLGGTLQAAAGAIIHLVNSSNLEAPAEAGELHLLGHIEAHNHLRLVGDIRNDGLLIVNGSVNQVATLGGVNRVRMLGTGEIQFNGLLDLPRFSNFTNGPDHAITGNGRISTGLQNLFINEGRIEAGTGQLLEIYHGGHEFLFQQRGELIASGDNGRLEFTGAMGNPTPRLSNDGLIESRDFATINVQVSEQFTNRGTMRVHSDATLGFAGDPDSNDDKIVNAAGAEINIEGTMLVVYSDLHNEPGAVIHGKGRLGFDGSAFNPRHRLINHGTLTVGDLVGRFDLEGDLQQADTGVLEIDLGGTSAVEEYDTVSTLIADLGGLLDVSLVDLGEGVFTPQLGDSFRILEATSNFIFGQFDNYSLPQLDPGLVWSIHYGDSAVDLRVIAPPQTDLDMDGDVDGADFLAVQQTDPALIPQWHLEYGTQVISSSANVQAVPEPTTLALCAALMASYLPRTRTGAYFTPRDRHAE